MEIKNTIFTIYPYKLYNQWVFDDKNVGLSAEALVAGADDLLSILSNDAEKCTVLFSPKWFPTSRLKIVRMDNELLEDYEIEHPLSGTYYLQEEMGHVLWLCNALLKYFTIPPDKIYIQIK